MYMAFSLDFYSGKERDKFRENPPLNCCLLCVIPAPVPLTERHHDCVGQGSVAIESIDLRSRSVYRDYYVLSTAANFV